MFARFGDSVVYTSTTTPRSSDGDVWYGFVDVDLTESAGAPDDVAGAFVNVIGAASSETDFKRLVSEWFERWGSPVSAWDEVTLLAPRARAPRFASWVAENFGLFHGEFHSYGDEADG